MKCDRAQDLILTDYLDGQLNEETKRELEMHLSQCAGCREFLLSARAAVVTPFEGAARQKTPDSVWQDIEQHLEKTSTTDWPERLKDFIGGLKNAFDVPRPVLAVAGGIGLCLLVVWGLRYGMMVQQNNLVEVEPQDEVEYLAYLGGTPLSENGQSGYGTDIEQYLL